MLHLIVGIFVAVAGCLSLNTARAEVIETTVAAGKRYARRPARKLTLKDASIAPKRCVRISIAPTRVAP